MNMKKPKKRQLTKSEYETRKNRIKSFVVLFVASVFFAFPLLYMLGTSFKSPADLQLHPERIFPSHGEWTLEHYEGFLWREGQVDNMPFWIFNSLWSSFASVVLTVLIDLITAYAVVFLKFRFKKIFIKFLYVWMAVPGILGTVPSFAMYVAGANSMELTGALRYVYIYMWMIVPGTTGIFNLILMKNFFESIPADIVESARSDGAKNRTIFRRIVIPLAKSTIMLIVLFTFVGSWNNLIFPQLILFGEDTRWSTVTVSLIGFTGGSGWGMVGVSMATSVFTLIPIIIIFIFTQNRMIDAIATTGIKM